MKYKNTKDQALTQIPKSVETFLKDLQNQIQAGTIDLTDWRSLGVGILNRINTVSATLRGSKTSSSKISVSKKSSRQKVGVKRRSQKSKAQNKKSVKKSVKKIGNKKRR